MRLRFVGAFLLNLVLAVVAPSILEIPFIRFAHFSDGTPTAYLKADLIVASAAFVLAYVIYRRWQPAAAKWVWIVGLFSFALRALLWDSGRELLGHHSVWVMFGIFEKADREILVTWSEFVVPLLRTAAYSAGALVCARVGRTGPTFFDRGVHTVWEAVLEGFVSREPVEAKERHETSPPIDKGL